MCSRKDMDDGIYLVNGGGEGDRRRENYEDQGVGAAFGVVLWGKRDRHAVTALALAKA